jgi:peptidoglycan/LPS O-acetylase OafA/YrhL
MPSTVTTTITTTDQPTSTSERRDRSPGPTMGYRPALDGVRAIAVAAVVLFHFEFAWIPGGFLGVDIFFVVSGYLITSLMIEEWGRTGGINRRQFWLRRGRRLLPALYLMLFVVCAWAVLFVPDALDRLRSDVVAALLYVTNWWYIIDGQSYFDALGRPPLLQHLWSLAVEEQWYLIWPFVFVFAMRRVAGALDRLVVPLLVAAGASAVWMAILFHATGDINRVYYGTDTHMSGLLIGAAAAMCWRPWRSRIAGHRHLLLVDLAGAAAVAALILIMLRWGSDTLFLYQGGFVLVALLAIVVVAAAVHPGARLFAGLLSLAPLRWIGMRSYAIYLWHWPVVVIFGARDLGWSRPAVLALWTILTLGLAEVSYRFVESPIRHGALTRWYHRLRTVEGSERSMLWGRAQVAGLAIVFVIGGLGVRLANAEKVDISLGGAQQDLTLAPAASTPAPPGSVPVATTLAKLPRRVAVVGDSQASALVKNAPNGLSRYLRVANGAVEGCGLVDSGSIVTSARFRREFDNCDGWEQRWGRAAAGNDVTLVVIGAWDVFDVNRDGARVTFGSPQEDRYLTAQLGRGIAAITGAGSKAALLQVPCYRNVDGGGLVALPERSDDRRTAHLNDLLRAATAADPEHVVFIPGPPEWCSDPAVATDLGYRWDGVHYYRPGAKLVFDAITPELLAIPA